MATWPEVQRTEHRVCSSTVLFAAHSMSLDMKKLQHFVLAAFVTVIYMGTLATARPGYCPTSGDSPNPDDTSIGEFYSRTHEQLLD